MSTLPKGFLTKDGMRFVDGAGETVRLRGTAIGGWLNMENFITGYASNEQLMRDTVQGVLGPERADLFFDRLLTAFFGEADAAFLADLGMNCIRIPLNYRHFEDDARPFEILDEGFRHLDRAIELCSRHGMYTVIDLHAVPGSQNHHWHSDNLSHVPAFWQHPHFQDRVVALWEVIADRYQDETAVAGYNPINEPADGSRAAVRALYERLSAAIGKIDPNHLLFLDGNTYSTEFDVFSETETNAVFSCHDYAMAGFIRGGDYPGLTGTQYWDRDGLERKYRDRTAYPRLTDTPVWVGEFGPVYLGDERADAMRYQILDDQLSIYDDDQASWSIWTYKDVGVQGLVVVAPDSPYRARFGEFIAKKNRLGADHWSSLGDGVQDVVEPFLDMLAREAPDFDPYPWGRADWGRTLLMNIAIAQPLTHEYAELFRGLSDDELLALADSFAFENCEIREPLVDRLRTNLRS